LEEAVAIPSLVAPPEAAYREPISMQNELFTCFVSGLKAS